MATKKDKPAEVPAMTPAEVEAAKEDAAQPGKKYTRYILYRDENGVFHQVPFNVYDVLAAYDVSCPATSHAIKKLLMPGQRGVKTRGQDLKEAIVSVQEAIRLYCDRAILGGPSKAD